MNILQEIHNEAKIGTRQKIRNNNKKILTISITLGIFFTFSFYYEGVGFFESRYGDNPLLISFLGSGLQSIIAMTITQFMIVYFWFFGKTTTLRIFKEYGKFNINSMLYDDLAPSTFAKRTDKHIFERLLKKLKPIFNDLRDEVFNAIHINQKKNDQRFSQLENKENQHLENERFYINHNLRLTNDLTKTKEENYNLKEQLKKKEQAEKIIDDVSFQTIRQEKLDKFQTRLDQFVQ